MSSDASVSSGEEEDKDVTEKENILEFESSLHNRLLFSQLAKFRDDYRLCDVVLVAKGTRISAHRLVLAARSAYFKAMFTNEMAERRLKEIEMMDVEALALDALIKYCYTGKITINDTNVLSILPATCLLQLDEVKEACCEFLVKELGPSNCLGIRTLADVYICPELLSCAEKYILHNFQDVVCTEEFYQLPVDRLIELISNEELHVRSEEQVFTAVVQWIKFDLAPRQQFLAKLLEHVRFSLCNPKFIVDTISKDELVMTDAACRNFVDEAKDYLLLQSYAHEVPNKQKPRMRPRKRPMCNKVLYVVGGMRDKEDLDSVEFLDLRAGNNVWQRAAPMVKKRDRAGVAVLYNMLYAIGGISRDEFNTPSNKNNERFDPSTNRWLNDVATSSASYYTCSVAVLDNWIYAVGGHSTYDCMSLVERYDVRRNEWSYVGNMQDARAGAAVSVLNGCLYALGGHDERTEWDTVERYDPREGKWEYVRPMSTVRYYLGSAVIDDCIYAVGGVNDSNSPLSSAEKYDPRNNEWILLPAMNSKRYSLALAAVDEKLYAVGGINDTTEHDTVEVFDPKENEWKLHSRLSDRRKGLGAGVVWMP